MRANLSVGGTVEGEPEAVARAVESDRQMAGERERWIADLRLQGVKAAHPDDGWVKRDENRVHLCYPDFDDGLAVGALLALGRPGRYRLVRITGSSEIQLAPLSVRAFIGHVGPWYWHFEGLVDDG